MSDVETVTPAPPNPEDEVVRHLLFHKALLADDEDPQRINEYISMVRGQEDGAHVGMQNPFDRALALAFELVLENHLDPWKIDLVQFASMYMAEVKEREEIDLITAGRILVMAWTVLRMKSQVLRERMEPPPEPEPFDEDPWFGVEAVDYEDPDVQYNQKVIDEGQVPIDEKIRHKGDRKVSFMELLDALEEARREAEMRAEIAAKREAEKRVRKAKRSGRAEGAAHKEDQEADIAEVWGRIAEQNGAPIPLRDIQENDRADLVKTLVSVLFLARAQRIKLWQEDFPYGMIYVQNPTPGEHVEPPKPEEVELAAADTRARAKKARLN